MPALSPTMTEGNIANWNVKEGDSFSAGDVLLEIETDKATMDVEAQDDGVMFKIMAQSGAKAIQVGTRIAVVAESGDDLASLEIPADEQAAAQQPGAPKPDESKKDDAASKTADTGARGAASSESHAVRYPLLPSVGHIVKEKGLSAAELSKITPTGPGGRLLKGDVLAYVGSISSDRPAALESHFDKLSHLDLSNIKVAEKKAPAPAPKEAEAAPKAPAVERKLEINVPVSLAKVVEVQNKIQDTLGVFLPLSTFISRAAEVANDNLPPVNRPPTTDELFDQVLGLDKVKAAKGSGGTYLPQISVIPPLSSLPSRSSKKADIIDVLAPKPKKAASTRPSVTAVPGLSSGANVFSLVVPKAEEKRAYDFLERCKVILEQDPGRLVL